MTGDCLAHPYIFPHVEDDKLPKVNLALHIFLYLFNYPFKIMIDASLWTKLFHVFIRFNSEDF